MICFSYTSKKTFLKLLSQILILWRIKAILLQGMVMFPMFKLLMVLFEIIFESMHENVISLQKLTL